jgi:hypothetical protein
MDDRSKGTGGGTFLHTRIFYKDEVLLLQIALNINFRLITTINEKVVSQWVIYIPVK